MASIQVPPEVLRASQGCAEQGSWFQVNDVAAALDFLDEATEGATRLRAPLTIRVVRPLTREDLVEVPRASPVPSLRETKSSHHTLAKLVAEGKGDVDASRITGYSPSYIARLRKDASFSELVLHYSEVVDLAATDFLGAMRETGMDALDELRKRIEREPEALTIGQLQDAVKLLLVEPMKSEALRGHLGATPAPVRISFITSEAPRGALIEGDVAQ